MDNTIQPVEPVAANRPLIPSCLYGHAFAGAGLILMGYLLAYMIRFESILGHWTGPAILTVVVMVMVMVLLTVRKDEESLSFGRAFGLSLLAGMLARMGYTVFNVLLFHVLRPDLVDAYVELIMDQTGEALNVLGGEMPMNMDQLLEQSTRFAVSIPGQLLDAVASVFWIGFVALVMAAFMKRAPAPVDGFKG